MNAETRTQKHRLHSMLLANVALSMNLPEGFVLYFSV